MYKNFFNSLSTLGMMLAIVFSSVFFFIKDWTWSVGIMTGTLWVFLNSYFLYQLFEMGLAPALGNHDDLTSIKQRARNRQKIMIFTILKFPVLYITGFYILKTRFFSVYSVLLGLTLYFFALGVVWFRFNQLTGRDEKSL